MPSSFNPPPSRFSIAVFHLVIVIDIYNFLKKKKSKANVIPTQLKIIVWTPD